MPNATQTPLRVAARLLHKAFVNIQSSQLRFAFYLQNNAFSEWAMLGSNQRPLPCEGGSSCSPLFASVQKLLQNS